MSKQYDVYTADQVKHERLTINVDGPIVTIDGPYWFGGGLLICDSYIGKAYYKSDCGPVAKPTEPVFHSMLLGQDGSYSGVALFSTGLVSLCWRPVGD